MFSFSLNTEASSLSSSSIWYALKLEFFKYIFSIIWTVSPDVPYCLTIVALCVASFSACPLSEHFRHSKAVEPLVFGLVYNDFSLKL